MEIKPEGVSLISDWSTEHAKFDPPRACQAGGVRQATYKIKCYKTKKDVLSRISDLFPMKDRQLQIDRQKKKIILSWIYQCYELINYLLLRIEFCIKQ